MDLVQRATAALRAGQVVLLFDDEGREGETDLVVASQHATPQSILQLRTDGGGLLCTALAPEQHRKLGLPFLVDLLQEAAAKHPVLKGLAPNDLRYDASKSSFGLTINSRATFTGIPDVDRSRTIVELAQFLAKAEAMTPQAAQAAFGKQFRSPGHAILLNGSDGGLAARQGHTELSIELMRLAGLTPCSTICEMLDSKTGKALSRKDAEAYAQRHGLVFLTGRDVIQAWQTRGASPIPPVKASA